MDILTFNLVEEKIKKLIYQKCSLNLSQTRLLLYFDSTQNKKISMGSLASALNISLSTLSRQINQKQTLVLVDLERAKYSSTKVLCLNQKGLDKVEQLRGLLNEIELILLDEWGKEEVLHFQNQLDKILSTLNEQVS
ncbi:MarR family winged helix-turn-helix transcriptional regulator [Lactobacillus rodentium]|uniref:MarR family transcriptional regulator n=1 Tax=Lactobacillus rodentium TaxID=947835 RepID=A0A2Z6T8M1_9LACO|nr:MarR family winged helix-turn-helix transcriptional regulator [Lactobacillus rodentium]MCR1894990.1 MarR family winged helix-turn-helix transcriptional regulator [Lactobacillus rodentium]GBG05291.1 MarR family transcriptional regulator [Lactobacillus rodentium]